MPLSLLRAPGLSFFLSLESHGSSAPISCCGRLCPSDDRFAVTNKSRVPDPRERDGCRRHYKWVYPPMGVVNVYARVAWPTRYTDLVLFLHRLVGAIMRIGALLPQRLCSLSCERYYHA